MPDFMNAHSDSPEPFIKGKKGRRSMSVMTRQAPKAPVRKEPKARRKR